MFWGKNINDDKYLISAFPAVADPTSSSFLDIRTLIDLMD